MGTEAFLAILAMMTLGAGAIFALVSKERTERLRRSENSEKSSLAADTPDR